MFRHDTSMSAGTSASSLRMPWDAVPPVPDKKVKKEGLMETMVGTGTLTGTGTGIKRGTMSAAFDVGSATPSMSSAVMSVKQGPVTAAPVSPLPPMYIHVSEGSLACFSCVVG